MKGVIEKQRNTQMDAKNLRETEYGDTPGKITDIGEGVTEGGIGNG